MLNHVFVPFQSMNQFFCPTSPVTTPETLPELAGGSSSLVTTQGPAIELFFFCYQQCFFIFFSHTAQHNIQNKTKQQTHTQHLKVQSKGRERGKDNKNTKVTPLNNHVYSTKNTAKHQWSKPGPTNSCRCTFT